MSEISLSSLSNHPSVVPSERRLRYTLTETNGFWWVLTATLEVEYHFMYDELWTPGSRGAFARRFERQAAQAWSRQHLLRQRGVVGDVLVEVLVRISPTHAPNARQWHVVVLPPESTLARTHAQYAYSGRLPPDTDDAQRPPGGEHTNIALIQVRASDLDCNFDHLSDGDRRDGSSLQRGADHEVGHMLGLQHPHCPGNERVCYGDIGDRRGGATIMGLGSWVTRQDYLWAKRILTHARGGVWDVVAERDGLSGQMCGVRR